MKKYFLLVLRLPCFLALFLWLQDSMISKTFLYADDSLSGLQQEVVYAKQKHEAIVTKMDAVQSLLDSQQLTQEPSVPGDPKSQADLKSEPSKELPKEVPVQKPSLVSKIKNVFKKEKSEKPTVLKPKKEAKKDAWNKNFFWAGLGYKDKKTISDGEALYKVAVSDHDVSLKEAVEIGVANNIQLRALKKKIEVADSKLVEAKRALFPTIQGVWQTNGGHVAGSVLATDGSTSLVPGQRFYKGETRKINVNQPLFYGGELTLTVKQAEENVKSAKSEYSKARSEYIHQVRTSYYGLVKAEYNVQYQTELNDKVDSIYKRVKEEHNQKLIAEVDFLNVESQYHQVYFQAESGKNDRQSADLVLHQALSLDSNEPLPVNLKLEFVPIHPQFEEMLNLSLQNNADVQIKEYALASAQYGIMIYKAKKLPRVDLRGSYGMEGEAFHDSRVFAPPGVDGSGTGNNDLEKEWFLGVHVGMPLGANSVEYDQIKHNYGPTVLALTGSDDWTHKMTFNLMDNFSNITDEKSAQAALLQSQSDLEKAKNDLTVKVRDDFYNLQKSLIQIDSSIAKVRYQGKQNSILEYMLSMQETAVSNYLEGLIEQAQNKFAFIQAVVDYHIAVSGLSLSIGDPNYFETES